MTIGTFIGLDLAWKIDGNHSGIVVLAGDADGVRLDGFSDDVTSEKDVVSFVAQRAARDCVLAIDASLVVLNACGQRPCEALIAQHFGRYHAACHPTNLGRPYAQTGPRLVDRLQEHGFEHGFDIMTARQRTGRWIFETYPHPAMVRLFGLERIIRYKKGTVAHKRDGLAILQRHLKALTERASGLVGSPLLAALLERRLSELRGAALKRYEDTLDALFCAYLAWYCWRWGKERNECYGTLSAGYIVVPKSLPPPP